MNFSFENQGNNTYLVMELPAGAEVDTMTLGMITNNAIPGVASVFFTQSDNVKYVKYNISAKISLAQLFEGVVNRRKILGAFSGICDSLLNAEDYMLEFDNFIFDMDKIYVNVSTLEVSLICIPFMGMQQNMQNLSMLFKTIMFSAQFDTTENNDYIGKIINYLNGPAFSVKEFKELLDILQGNVPVTPVAPTSTPVPAAPTAPITAPQPVSAPQAVSAPQPMNATNSGAQSAPVASQPVKAPQPVAQPQVSAPVAPAVQPIPVANPGMAIPPMGMPQPPSKNGKEKKVKPVKEPKAPKAPKEPKPSKKDKMKGVGAPVPGMAIPGQPSQPIAPQPMAQPVVPQAVRPMVQSVAPQPMAQPVAPQPMAQPVVPQPIAQPVAPQPAAIPRMTGFTGNFGETTVLGSAPAIGETTVLGASPVAQVQPYLIRKKTDERIPLNKPVFRIGKEKSYVDYFISDNTAISRSHANVIMREGKYYVMDTNSTNHTFVNGQLLQSNVETEITHGTVVKLANEEFEFRAY